MNLDRTRPILCTLSDKRHDKLILYKEKIIEVLIYGRPM